MLSLVILLVLAISNVILFLGMIQVYLRNKDRHFYYAAFFFLICGLIQLEQFTIEYGVPAGWAVFVARLQVLGLIALIYLIPFFTEYFTRKRMRNFIRLGLAIFCLTLYGLTLFTNLIIRDRAVNHVGYNEGEQGVLFIYVMFAVALTSLHFPVRIAMLGRRNMGILSYTVLLAGYLLVLAGGLLTLPDILAHRPLFKALPEPFYAGLGALSFSFAWILLAQYSSLFSSLGRSRSEARSLHDKTNQSLIEFIQLVAKTLDAKDPHTAGHSLRVMDYSLKIAQVLKLPERDQEILRNASLLHDIGKIAIPDGILNKKSALNEQDREHIYRHPVVGRQILSTVSDFEDILDIIYYHHERVDGKGYPKGLSKHEIPLLARIIAVADTYDAIMTQRTPRKGKGRKDAVEELKKARGTQLDEEIVDAFLKTLKG